MSAKGWIGSVVLTHWLTFCHELFEACTVDVNPGSPMSVVLLFERHHAPGRKVPANWWTWLVQYLIPNGGPAVTSYAAAGEGFAVVSVSLLLATIEALVTKVTAEVHGPTAPVPAGLVPSVQPVPAGGSPARLAPSPLRQGGSDEQIPGDDRGRRTRTGRL